MRTFAGGSIPVIIASMVAFAYVHTLAPGITWANQGTDSGDLVTAAATLGIAHPTGYPTYTLLVHLFQYLPVGTLAFRANLFSAWAASMTVVGVYLVVRTLLTEQQGMHKWQVQGTAVLAAGALACSPLFWSQAVIAEVYSLHTLFVVLFLFWTVRASQPGLAHEHQLRWQAFVAGLALGNHITILLSVGVWLGVLLIYAPQHIRGRLLRWVLAWGSIGLIVYAYLPIRAAAYPPVNWGNPQTWEGFWWVLSANLYHDFAFGLPAQFIVGRLGKWAALLLDQFGWLGTVLGCIGVVYGRDLLAWSTARWKGFVGSTSVMVGAYSLFALLYDTTDSFAFLLPVYVIFAVWLGIGCAVVIAWGQQWRGVIAPGLFVGIGIMLFWHVPTTAAQVDASSDYQAITYAHNVLAAAPAQAIIITSGDRDTFPLWYEHYATGKRSDIVIIVEPLLHHTWYRENLQATYPTLALPETRDKERDKTLARANGRILCRIQLDNPPFLACRSYFEEEEAVL